MLKFGGPCSGAYSDALPADHVRSIELIRRVGSVPSSCIMIFRVPSPEMRVFFVQILWYATIPSISQSESGSACPAMGYIWLSLVLRLDQTS